MEEHHLDSCDTKKLEKKFSIPEDGQTSEISGESVSKAVKISSKNIYGGGMNDHLKELTLQTDASYCNTDGNIPQFCFVFIMKHHFRE